MRHWEYLKSESAEAEDYKIFKVRKVPARSPRNDALQTLSVIEAPDWVNVIARTPEGSYVLVRQVRHGVRQEMVETPGGTVDPGEDPLETARRELCEETGYVSDQWRKLGQIHPNPAILNNQCHIFVADHCSKAQEPEQDDGEDIQVELWPKDRVMQALRTCEISCALVVASFLLLGESER